MIKIAITDMMPDGVTPNLNQLYWLVGDPVLSNAVHSALADENRSISRKVIPESGVNFPFVVPQDGKNEQLNLSVKTTRTFDDIVSNWRWRNAFSKRLASSWPHPCFGTCLMRFELPDGTFEEVTLPKCYVAKPGMKPDGVSLELSYNIQGGEIEEDFTTGQVVIPLAESGAILQMKVYSTIVAGSITDAFGTVTGALTGTLGVGDIVTIQGVDNLGDPAITKDFQIISGGSPSPGMYGVDHPWADNLADVVAGFAAETKMSAEYVDDGVRPYVLISWLDTPIGDLDEVRITTVGYKDGGLEIYEGTTNAEQFPTTIFPVDINGSIPTASIPV